MAVTLVQDNSQERKCIIYKADVIAAALHDHNAACIRNAPVFTAVCV